MKVKLKNGEMDDKLIEFDSQAPPAIGMQVMGPFGMDDMGINIQEIVGNLMPKKKKKKNHNCRSTTNTCTGRSSKVN